MSALEYPFGLRIAPGLVTTETAPALVRVAQYQNPRTGRAARNVWVATFDDHDGGPRRRILTEGPKVAKFIERWCVYTQAEWVGQPFILLEWQRSWLCELFELGFDPETGEYRRRYHNALLGVPKKNGKSDLLAALGMYFLLADGDLSPVIAAAAAGDESAQRVFLPCKVMVESSGGALQAGGLRELLDPWEDRILVVGKPAAGLYRVPASPKHAEGLNVSKNLFDEWHEWTTASQVATAGKLLNATVVRPTYLNIRTTTAGSDKATLCGEDYAFGCQVASGDVTAESWFFRWYEAPATVVRDGNVVPLDWRSEEAVRLANPSFGTLQRWFFYEERLLRISEGEYRRYYLNQWTATEESWLPDGGWASNQDMAAAVVPAAVPMVIVKEAEAVPGRELRPLFAAGARTVLVPGWATFLGVDASYRRDSTAIVAAQLREVPDFETRAVVPAVNVEAWIWDHPLDPATRKPIADWIVPRAEVMATLRGLFRVFKVVRCEYDPAFFHDAAVELADEGYRDEMREFSQNNLRKMVEACQATYTLTVSRRIRHTGDPRLSRHIANAVAKQVTTGAAGWTLKKGAAKGQMDAAMALVMAVWGLQHPGETKKKPSPPLFYTAGDEPPPETPSPARP